MSSTFYVAEMRVDRGERIHVTAVVRTDSRFPIPFVIGSACWELRTSDNNNILVSSGPCQINDHELDAFVEFIDSGKFYLTFVYNIADETWIDKVLVRVG